MIQNPDIDECKSFLQSLSDELIRLARLRDAGRMIVREDDCRGVVGERLAHHFARMHARPVDGAAEELFEGDQPMTVVEVQAAEHFVGPIAQMRGQEGARSIRRDQRGTQAQCFAVVAPGQLEGGLQQRVAGRAHAALPRARFEIGAQQLAQRAELRQEHARQIHGIGAGDARAEEHGEQLRVRERMCAAFEELFAGALGTWPLTDVHVDGHPVGGRTLRQTAARGRATKRAWIAENALRLRRPWRRPDNRRMQGRRILLGVTGGIAAYKSAELVRRLRERGAEVQVVMSAAAREFVGAATFQALSGRAVRQDLWDPAAEAAMGHIELARWADLVLIAPASADFLARLAGGVADDLLTTLCLATEAPLAVAPAMNRVMWANAATQANVATLGTRQVQLWGPAEGEQACGEVGPGRMLEPADLADRVAALLGVGGPLAGRRVLLTAGPTRERIDPVRFISNRSSGKMGFAVAQAARLAGADVTLVTGPVALATPAGVRRIDVESAAEMLAAVLAEVGAADIFISTAAVADYRPTQAADQKIKKTSDRLDLAMERTVDILGTVAQRGRRPFVVGFAAETESVEHHARAKLLKKNLDMIAANEVGDRKVFEQDHNSLIVLWRGGRRELAHGTKQDLARSLIDLIVQRYSEYCVAAAADGAQHRGTGA